MKKIFSLLFAFLITATATGESLVFPPFLHTYGIRKAGPMQLFLFMGSNTSFSDPQGLATARLESWDDPKTEKDDDEVVVYGLNSGRGEILYNTSMLTLGLYGEKGSGKDQFMFPKGIAADSRGNVFVADSGNGRIVRLFNPNAGLEWRGVIAATKKNSSAFSLCGPSRVALDEDVNVYAADPVSGNIVVFDSTGKTLRIIPGPADGFLFENGPTALAAADGRARWSYYSGEKILFCADRKGTRLWKIGFDGKGAISSEMPLGYSASHGAIDYYHNYWVTDTRKNCILKFDHNLHLLDIFESKNSPLNEPRGIAIYKRYGQVFVAEKKGAQYFWIGTELKKFSLNAISTKTYRLTLECTDYSLVTLFSAIGKDTVSYFKRRWVAAGPTAFNFDCYDNESAIRAKGLTLKIEPTYSSFSYNSWEYPVIVNK